MLSIFKIMMGKYVSSSEYSAYVQHKIVRASKFWMQWSLKDNEPSTEVTNGHVVLAPCSCSSQRRWWLSLNWGPSGVFIQNFPCYFKTSHNESLFNWYICYFVFLKPQSFWEQKSYLYLTYFFQWSINHSTKHIADPH